MARYRRKGRRRMTKGRRRAPGRRRGRSGRRSKIKNPYAKRVGIRL